MHKRFVKLSSVLGRKIDPSTDSAPCTGSPALTMNHQVLFVKNTPGTWNIGTHEVTYHVEYTAYTKFFDRAEADIA